MGSVAVEGDSCLQGFVFGVFGNGEVAGDGTRAGAIHGNRILFDAFGFARNFRHGVLDRNGVEFRLLFCPELIEIRRFGNRLLEGEDIRRRQILRA